MRASLVVLTGVALIATACLARPLFHSAPLGKASARVVDPANRQVGTVTFTDTPTGLLITGTVAGLGLGAHGVHFHQVGRCEASFATAGAHFNPSKHQHGYKNPSGPHAGDLPNIVTPAAGAYSFEMVATGLTVAALAKGTGTAIVFHASGDDYVTDPSGNSGARIGCGVVTRE
jgi:Cu-Zn family superoxide dismutase